MKRYATSTLGTACCISCSLGGPCAAHPRGALGFTPIVPAGFDWKWLALAIVAAYLAYRYFGPQKRRKVGGGRRLYIRGDIREAA